MTARALAWSCSAPVLALREVQGARARTGAPRCHPEHREGSRPGAGDGSGLRPNACSSSPSTRETTHGSPQGTGRGEGARLRSRVSCMNDHVCAGSVPLSRRERGRGEGSHLRSRVSCVNAGSRAEPRRVVLFRAAAAARATFLAGKVAKAIHAAACAVLRTVTSFAHPALRKSRCPRLLSRALDAARPACWQVASATSRPALLAGRLVRSRILLRGQAQPAPSGRGRAAHALRPARTRPSMGSNKRAFPSRPAALLGAGQRYERQRQQRVLLIFNPHRQRRDCVGKARSVSAMGEAATAALTRRRPGMAIGAPRAGTRTRAAGAAVGVGFLWFLSLPIQRKEPARRQPHGTGQPCQAQRMNHRSRAMRGARLRKSAPSPGAMRHPRPVGEGKCARSLTRAMPRQYQGGPPPARQRMSAHAHRHD